MVLLQFIRSQYSFRAAAYPFIHSFIHYTFIILSIDFYIYIYYFVLNKFYFVG